MISEVLGFATVGLVILSALLGAVFVLVYWLRWKWWRHPVGRQMMALMAGFDMIIWLAVLSFFWSTMPGRVYIRFGCWLVTAFLFAWTLLTLIKVKRSG